MVLKAVCSSSRCCSLRCRATSRSTVRWQLPVSLAFLGFKAIYCRFIPDLVLVT